MEFGRRRWRGQVVTTTTSECQHRDTERAPWLVRLGHVDHDGAPDFARPSIVKRVLLLVAAALALGAPAPAQHSHQHGSPYNGTQSRPVKSLSDDQIADLRAGRGMGM